MDVEGIEFWMRQYGEAWEKGDPAAMSNLFSDTARYVENPFEQPLKGRDAIHKYMMDVPRSQESIHFQFEALGETRYGFMAHWTATFVRRHSGRHVHLNGIIAAEFDEEGLCSAFQEWWHKQESMTE
jgi:hypothetical protein